MNSYLQRSMTDAHRHALMMRTQLDRARNKSRGLYNFLDVIVVDTDLRDDQIDVAIADAQAVLRALRSARQHADMR